MLRRYLYRVYYFWSGVTHRGRRRFTPAGFLAMSCLVAALALGTDTLFSMTYQTLVFLVSLIGISWAWAVLSRGDFAGTRFLPRYGTAGQILTYHLRLQNRTRRKQRQLMVSEETDDPRPSFEMFQSVAEPGEGKRNRFDRFFGYYRWRWLLGRQITARTLPQTVPDLEPGESVSLTCRVQPRRRGRLRLTGVTVFWPAPFGLCRAWHHVSQIQSILILPKRYRLPPLALPGTHQYQPGGVAQARAVGESEEFVGLRDYRAGDPIRHIHWRSWAKVGRPIVKEYQDEFFVRHALILDTFHAQGEDDLFEEAVSVAASFACTIEEEDSLLDLLFVGDQAYCFTAGRGLAHPEQLLSILACVPACRDRSFDVLENLVLRHAPLVDGTVCVLLSWDEARQRLVRRLKAIGVPVMVYVMAPAGGCQPGAGAGSSSKMAEEAGEVHFLEVGKIGDQLARL